MTSSAAVTTSTATKLSGAKVAVAESSPAGAGRGLRVTVGIPAGSLIVRVDPLLSVLDNELLDKACSGCFAASRAADNVAGKDLLKCTGCSILWYCSKACQKKDWKTHHSKECKYFQHSPGQAPPGFARGVMRLVNLYAGEEKNLAFAADVAKLLSHIDEIEHSKRWMHVEQILQGVNFVTTATGGRPITADGKRGIQQLICKMMINSLTLSSPSFDPLGLTFDPTISLINHSCNPNAAVVFDGNIAMVRSIRDIGKNEQITMSYIDNTWNRTTRRTELREQYFFECRCDGCEPANNNFTGRDSFQCEKEDCKALIPEPLLKGDKLVCSKCGSKQSTSLDEIRSLESKARAALVSTQGPSPSIKSLLNDTLLPTLATLTSCPSWPPIRQPAPALRKQITLLALDAQSFEAAYHHSSLLSQLPLLDLHPEPYHPLRTVAVFTTASLIQSLGAQENNLEYMKRAWELLRVTWGMCRGSHGEGTKFAESVAVKRKEVEMDLAMGGEDLRRWMREHP